MTASTAKKEFTNADLWAQGEDTLSELNSVRSELAKVVEFTEKFSQLLAMIPPEVLQMAQMQLGQMVGR